MNMGAHPSNPIDSPDWNSLFVAAAILWKVPSVRAVELTGNPQSVAPILGLPRPERAAWVADVLRGALRQTAPDPWEKSRVRRIPAARVLPGAPRIDVDAPTEMPAVRHVPAALLPTEAAARALLRDAEIRAEQLLAKAEATIEERVSHALYHEKARLAALAIRLDTRAAALETNAIHAAEERLYPVAAALAETLIGETIAVDPLRIAPLLDRALAATTGAGEVSIVAHPEDAATLRPLVGDLITIGEDASLSRGSLTVYTERGSLDARLSVQLRALTDALQRG